MEDSIKDMKFCHRFLENVAFIVLVIVIFNDEQFVAFKKIKIKFFV